MTEKKKEFWPIGKLKNWKDNPRGISKKGFERLKKQIKRFGQLKPMIVCQGSKALPDGTVLGGNMRLKAHQEIGTKELWISPVTPKTKAEALEIALTDNDRAGYYEEDVLAELAHGFDIDFNDYGVDLREPFPLDDLISNYASNNEKDDIVPEPRKTNIKLGDMFQLGEHRLLCGDATKKEDVERLMSGEKADMVFTDPPYGVSYNKKNEWLNSIGKANAIGDAIEGDEKSVEKLADSIIYPAFCRIKEVLGKQSSYYITAPQGGELLMMMMMMMMKAGLTLRHMLIWVKNNHVLGRTDYNYKHEPILFGWVDTHKFYGNGEFQFSTWEIDKPLKSNLHPTMKPIALIVNALQNSTVVGNLCLDLFGGSGSTLIACEKLNRKCRMMEIDPIYCHVIVDRWEEFTGKKAKKE